MAFAAHQLHRAAPVGRGISRGDALDLVARLRGTREGDEGVALPGALAHVWRWFVALANADATLAPRRPAELAADVAALTGLVPTAFETELLLRLLALWREAAEAAATFNDRMKQNGYDGNGQTGR